MVNFSFMSERSFEAIIDGSTKFVVEPHCYEGYHITVDYPNGFTASIVKFRYGGGSCGHACDLWEIAIFYDGVIRYNTPITDDVIGWLKDYEVVKYCNRIRELTKDDIAEDYDQGNYHLRGFYEYDETTEDD